MYIKWLCQMRVKLHCLGSPKNNHWHWQIEGCRWRAHWLCVSLPFPSTWKFFTWSIAPYTVTEKLLYIIKGPMKVISGLLPETWGYFCMKTSISTARNCHSHIHESTHFILFALLKVHPRFFSLVLACGPPKLMCPGAPSRLTPKLKYALCSLKYILIIKANF
jgi:hypothetical protein